ncbi:S-layer homology domain-containing protein [Chengkuizengella axinellae]|uniref:S-layer homology domain-containing protein n=1 Tax=Chengkuizengella axinellae TaxID=3064388 RepID=A0ABT9J0Z0_9BACL|nr:S-layer homology domain-containing protein [Chengkuizengella sp. 2205SS18-9]MDP5275240.1 S-layer homology domain-containing protein [Chengkuizengella sp. 2205SS18-9]
MIKLIKYILILTFVFLVVSTSAIAGASSFTDTKSHWAESSIEKMSEEGHIGGYPDGSFKPEGQITRAEFTAILTRIVGIDEVKNPFQDANDAKWADGIIGGAEEVGMIEKSEYGSNFNPNTPITRLEMAKMIARAFVLEDEYEGKFDTYISYDQNDLIFKDAKDIKDKDAQYVAFATDLEIIGGYPDKTFKPSNQATRAEAVVMLLRFMDNDIDDSGSTSGSGDIHPNPDDSVSENPAYDPNLSEVNQWINTTRISPSYLKYRAWIKADIENGTARPRDVHDFRFNVEELLWNYYQGEIPLNSYEEEVMERIAHSKDEPSWEDMSEYDKARYSSYSGDISEAMLLSFSFDKNDNLDWVVVRPVGMRHAFKITVDDPLGSVVLNRAWAGRQDDKFDAVFAEVATPQLLNQIIETGAVIGVYQNSNPDDVPDHMGLPALAEDWNLREREIRRTHSDNVVKTIYGGDFALEIGGIFKTNADIVSGSTIIPKEFLEIKPYTKGSVKTNPLELY